MKKIAFVLFVTITILNGCAAKKLTIDPVYQVDGVVIALLDTGISTVAIDERRILSGFNYVENSQDSEDKVNHGTAVASAIVGSESAKIVGLAENAYLVPLVMTTKGEDGKLQGVTPETLAQAIYDSIDKYGADIINISLGIKKDVSEVKKAIAYAEKQRVLVVSAMGNEGEEGDYYYPATYDTVLGVGSHNDKGEISDFSQQNGIPNLLAPGEDIWFASKNGKTYGSRGTSYATAYVAAAAARLLAEKPDLSPEQVREILFDTGTDIGSESFCILNLDVALDYVLAMK